MDVIDVNIREKKFKERIGNRDLKELVKREKG